MAVSSVKGWRVLSEILQSGLGLLETDDAWKRSNGERETSNLIVFVLIGGPYSNEVTCEHLRCNV